MIVQTIEEIEDKVELNIRIGGYNTPNNERSKGEESHHMSDNGGLTHTSGNAAGVIVPLVGSNETRIGRTSTLVVSVRLILQQ